MKESTIILCAVYRNIFKCEMCGNCCKYPDKIALNDSDICLLADHFKISTQEVINKYIHVSGKNFFFKQSHPCQFLKDNKCSIYQSRPLTCRVFPIHFKKFYPVIYILSEIDGSKDKSSKLIKKINEQLSSDRYNFLCNSICKGAVSNKDKINAFFELMQNEDIPLEKINKDFVLEKCSSLIDINTFDDDIKIIIKFFDHPYTNDIFQCHE